MQFGKEEGLNLSLRHLHPSSNTLNFQVHHSNVTLNLSTRMSKSKSSKSKKGSTARSGGKNKIFRLSTTQKKSLGDLVKRIGDGSNLDLRTECVQEAVERIIVSTNINQDDLLKITVVEKVWNSSLYILNKLT